MKFIVLTLASTETLVTINLDKVVNIEEGQFTFIKMIDGSLITVNEPVDEINARFEYSKSVEVL